MATKKNLFQKTLTMAHKDIRGKRAQFINDDAIEASENYMRELRNKERNLEKELNKLEDLHPTSTLSLKVTVDGFDADAWVREINRVTCELQVLRSVKIANAKSIHEKYFEV